jgi:LmbE family N-acetylglucosaminyl deacetylase
MEHISSLDELGISPKHHICIVMPHPDDEAVFLAGFLQSLAANHIPTTIVTVTRGEKSTLRHGLSPDAPLASIRYDELLKSLRLSGHTDQTHIHIWNFPDGGIEDHVTEISKKLTALIDRIHPTHLLTLEPDGIYGHPDHIALSSLVTKIAATKKLLLIYATVRPGFIFGTSRKMAKKERIVPLAADYCFHLSLREIITKWRMLKAHGSQFLLTPWDFKTYRNLLKNQIFYNEYFSLVYPK